MSPASRTACTPRASDLIELPSPFKAEKAVIRLLEPPTCDRKRVLRQVLSGTYDKPFVIDDGEERALYFSRDYIQSAMRVDDPYALEFAYTRKMMSFLLFRHAPREILMLGLGGGSLAKYCHRHLAGARITVVEIDPHIVAFRDQFLVPPDQPGFEVVLADAAEYVRQRPARELDVVVVDAFDRDGASPSICSADFYRNVRAILARDGVMVANLVGNKAQRTAHLDMIRAPFGDNVVLIPVRDDGNHLAFAFRDASFEPRWRWIHDQARAMRARYGLDFPAFAGMLERSRKLGYLRRELQPN
jgi:spermidine synthase